MAHRLLRVSSVLAQACLIALQAFPQTPAPVDRPAVVITWFGPGALRFPDPQTFKLESANVYDNGQRPVVTTSNEKTHVTASFIVFENQSGKPTAEGCQADVIDPLVKRPTAPISDRVDATHKATDGTIYPTTAYTLAIPNTTAKQRNLFVFAGDAKTCAEEHISIVATGSEAEASLQAALAEFHPMLGYSPQFLDFFYLATLLFHESPGAAAPYYKEALDRTDQLPWRRVITDQLVMSLGMSGDLKNSRGVAEMAIKTDPDYPINYYNLACADAEQGKAADAQLHLQQAFNRKANTLPGEHMPDPTTDDSILKLKKDKEFWAFIQTLK